MSGQSLKIEYSDLVPFEVVEKAGNVFCYRLFRAPGTHLGKEREFSSYNNTPSTGMTYCIVPDAKIIIKYVLEGILWLEHAAGNFLEINSPDFPLLKK